jgi:hypothetical protein
LDLRRSKSGSLDETKVGISDKLLSEPEEGLLKIVVALCRDIIILEILLSTWN